MLGLRVAGVAPGDGWLPLDDSRHHFAREKKLYIFQGGEEGEGRGCITAGRQERNRKRRILFSVFSSDVSRVRGDFSNWNFSGPCLAEYCRSNARALTDRSASAEYRYIDRRGTMLRSNPR